MADFTDKKIRTFYENVLRNAGAEDLALLMAVLKPELKAALERIQALSTKDLVQLDPLQDKPAKAPGNVKAED